MMLYISDETFREIVNSVTGIGTKCSQMDSLVRLAKLAQVNPDFVRWFSNKDDGFPKDKSTLYAVYNRKSIFLCELSSDGILTGCDTQGKKCTFFIDSDFDYFAIDDVNGCLQVSCR